MAVIRRVHVPLLAPEAVIPHLGAPHHWKAGRSAKCLIDQWWSANGLPKSVQALLSQAPEWSNAVLLDAFAERCTDLQDGRPSHSQSDLLALVGIDHEIGVLTIEAKVDEGFDKTVADWLARPSAGKQARLAKLCELLRLPADRTRGLRYQLLHRTASAVIEAKRYRTKSAAMIVQSWSPLMDGFENFQAFALAIGVVPPDMDRISQILMIDGVALRLGWSNETRSV